MSPWPFLWFWLHHNVALVYPQVFNLNAPVPPANETEALNQANQYQNSYNQAFNSQSQHPVEQTDMQSEQLQSGGQTFIDLLDWLCCACFLTSHIYLNGVHLPVTRYDLDLFSSSWCLPFPRPVRRPSTALPAGPRLRQAGSVLLQ